MFSDLYPAGSALKFNILRTRLRQVLYNARHTYATMLLMDGVNPMFVADQLGHSLQMLIKRYTKWLHGDKNKQEIAKLSVTRTA